MNNLLALSTGAIADIVALALVLIFAIVGLKQGFAKSFISTFGTLIALVLASLLCNSFATFLQNKFGLVETIGNALPGTLSNIFGEDVMNVTLAQATENKLSEAGVASWIINIVISMQNNTSIPTDTTLNQILCPTIAYYVVIVIAFVLLLIIFKILLWLLGKIIIKMYTIKAIKITDCTLGFVFGLIKGILIAELIIMVISILPIGFFQTLTLEMQSAPICTFLNNINLYSLILNSITNNGSLTDIVSNIIK